MSERTTRGAKRRRTDTASSVAVPDDAPALASQIPQDGEDGEDGDAHGNARPSSSTIDPADAADAGMSSEAKARRAPRGTACWICLDGLPDDSGERPFHAGCACRGGAGFAHPLCKEGTFRNMASTVPPLPTPAPRVVLDPEGPACTQLVH